MSKAQLMESSVPSQEHESSELANSMAPPKFSLEAGTAQLQINPIQREEDPGEAIEDASSYYVTDANATIRNNSNPGTFSGNAIPQGTKVKRLRTYDGTKVAQVEVVTAAPGSSTAAGTKYWTTFSNVAASANVTDTKSYFIAYSDTYLRSTPGGPILTTTTGSTTSNQSLSASNSTGYTITERCGVYVKVKQGEVEKGWIVEGNLIGKVQADRGTYMTDLKTWLNSRYTEVSALEGTAKTDRAKGILSKVEEICHNIEEGTYPTISELPSSPTFVDNTFRTFVPPELIGTVRKFIEVYEAADGLTDLDWNPRLGVPQYRPQTDNVAPPEATCGPTSFAMAAERIGHSRGDIIASIDEELTGHRRSEYRKQQYLASPAGVTAAAAGGEVPVPANFEPNIAVPLGYTPATAYPSADLETKWKDKAEAFFKSFSGDNWQKLRANKGGLIGKEDDLSEDFREWGQYEDFVYMRAWMHGISRGNIANSSSQTMLDDLHNPSMGSEDTAGTNSEKIEYSSKQKVTTADRAKVQACLQEGGAAVLSLYHKGSSGGTHIVTIREVTTEGFALDDPYGQINPEYRRNGTTQDAFKDKDGASGRKSYDWRNVEDFDKTETDYSQRDFTESAAENLEDNESRGKKSMITWKMIEESTTQLVYYIRMYKRR